MTTKDAILKLADAVSGSTSANVATDVQALAVLAQAMTGGVPAEPLATVDDAIGYIADNYSGGGGGVDVGELAYVVGGGDVPEVGEYASDYSDVISGIAIGDSVIVPVSLQPHISYVASGATVTTSPSMDDDPTSCDAYVATVNEGQVTAVAPWDGTLTPGTYISMFGNLNIWTFDVPALEYDLDTEAGQILYLRLY